MDWTRRLEVGNSSERVHDDRGLDFALMVVTDVRVETAAAKRIGGYLSASRRGLFDGNGVCVHHAFADALDDRGDPFAGDSAGHEDNLAIKPSDHPAAGGRFFDGEGNPLTRGQHLMCRQLMNLGGSFTRT
jgi:hypothetical protein